MSDLPADDPVHAKIYELRDEERRSVSAAVEDPAPAGSDPLAPASPHVPPTMDDVRAGFSNAFRAIGFLAAVTVGTAKAGVELLQRRDEPKP